MAGGWGPKFDPKNKSNSKLFGSEVLKDSHDSFSASKADNKPVFSLLGVLGLVQTIELGKKEDNLKKWNKEFLGVVNYLQKQEQFLLNNQQKELENSIKQLQEEIQKLTKASDKLEKDVEKVVLQPVVEFNEYQINFLNRIRKFIRSLRENISEASIWMESFNSKKKKRNYFWNTAKNKKKGGEQYLFSGEHSVSRSGA